MDTYRYQHLNLGSIRLLEFRSLHDKELAFDIHHKKLDSWITSYIALSYRWGKGKTSLIKIGDSYLNVTENLKDALIHIKERFAKKLTKSSALLWVDAICINQSDNVEKSQQVSIMGQIYSEADKVFVWLGRPENDENMRLAVEKLALINKIMHAAYLKNHSYRPWWWPRERQSLQRNDLSVSTQVYEKVKKIFDGEGTASYAAWQGIVEIWQNGWWKRVWIAQECTIKEPFKTYMVSGVQVHKSNPKVHFLCGQHTTFWDHVLHSTRVAEILLKMPLLSASTGFLKGAYVNVSRIGSIRMHRLLNQETELMEQLQLTRHCESTNPRDKIYANLGLIAKSAASSIHPNYDKSLLDTYLDIVRIQLEQATPSLDFLGYAMKLDEPRRELSKEISHEKWPSWIPNWDDPLLLFPLPKKLYRNAKKTEGRSIRMLDKDISVFELVETGNAYNATRSERVNAFISRYKLHIKGAILDTIVERHSYQEGTIAERRERINRWYTKQGKKYPNGEDFNKGLLSIQVADVKRDIRGNATARGNALNQELLNKRHAELTPEEETAQAEMQACLNRATSLRGLCLTKRGYLGLVPWSARKGDHICLLLGGQVLYVLRPRPNESRRYEYIGECCVYALMDGEALDWIGHGHSWIEEFVLV